MAHGEQGRSFAAWRLGLARLVRVLAAPLVVALPPLYWVLVATQRASLSPLGRDQGIFQYIGWALSQGQRDYVDVRDVNGPLTHFIHRAFLWLGGADEHRFRILDLVFTGLAFALVGACLPGIGRDSRARSAVRSPELVERIGWAFAAWVVLSAQYLGYLYWDLAQRESFFDWFLLASVALQLAAQTRWLCATEAGAAKRQKLLLALTGALSVVPCFGKPTYAIFTAVQVLALVIDRDLLLKQKARLLFFGAGVAAGTASQLAILFIYGDLGAYLKIAFHDVPAMYRFIWPRAASEIFSNPRFATPAALGLVTGLAMLALIALGQLPRRALAVALLPACGLVSVVAQAKGFPYHFHPVTAGIHLQWLVLVVWAWERARRAPRKNLGARLLPIFAAAMLALRVATELGDSPHIRNVQVAHYATPELRETPEYFALYPEPDYFPYELRQAAAYLRAHTTPKEKVQVYGMDPYILFFAERLSATPYIYAYDLNADAALHGGTGAAPDLTQTATIQALRDAHEKDLLERLVREPPAAFVFLDKSPLMTWSDAWYDFEHHCPDAAAWIEPRYEESAVFGAVRIWLRKDPPKP